MAKSKKRLVISSGRVNRKGYRILPEGIDYSDFLNNPVLLGFHDDSELPIGRVEDIEIIDGKLTAIPVFDSDDPVAAEYERKYENNFLHACSLRHDPQETSTDAKYILPGQRLATVVKTDLLELSFCSLQGDAGAHKLSNDADINSIIPKLNLSIKNTMDKDFSKVLTALGLNSDATEADALTKVNELKATVESSNKAKVDTLLSLGTQKGFITDANKDQYNNLAMADYDSVAKLISDAPEAPEVKEDTLSIKNLLSSQKGVEGKGGEDKLSFSKLEKEDPKLLNQLRLEKPDLYSQMANSPDKGFSLV